VTKHKGL